MLFYYGVPSDFVLLAAFVGGGLPPVMKVQMTVVGVSDFDGPTCR